MYGFSHRRISRGQGSRRQRRQSPKPQAPPVARSTALPPAWWQLSVAEQLARFSLMVRLLPFGPRQLRRLLTLDNGLETERDLSARYFAQDPPMPPELFWRHFRRAHRVPPSRPPALAPAVHGTTAVLQHLPWKPFHYRPFLPSLAAVYFCLTEAGMPLYIGQTDDLQARWACHPQRHRLRERGCARIAWLEALPHELLQLEADFIQQYQPPLNTNHIPPPPRTAEAAIAPVLRSVQHLLSAEEAGNAPDATQQALARWIGQQLVDVNEELSEE